MKSHHDLISLFEHDLFGKPVSTFPDHASSACSTARRAITTTRWARYSLSAWMSELRPDGAIEMRIRAAGEKFAASASSISLDRNTTGPAPVMATRTLPSNFATNTPTSAKRDAWLLNFP